jgi:two-component system response regulator YesN
LPYHLLVVDDDSAFRNEFAEILSEDYRVTAVGSGKEALAVIERPNDVDLVILDEMMPDLRGTNVLRRLKTMEPSLAVLILTGYSSTEIAVRALRGDADEYMEKPVNIARAKEVLADLLRKTRAVGDIKDGGVEGKVERVKHFLNVNYHKAVKLEDAARAVCLSPKYLSRLFKERVGTGFNEYKLTVKIEKAKEMLGTSRRSVFQISSDLGYRNPESFIRMFKKLTGLTPSDYRKKATKRAARSKGRRAA